MIGSLGLVELQRQRNASGWHKESRPRRRPTRSSSAGSGGGRWESEAPLIGAASWRHSEPPRLLVPSPGSLLCRLWPERAASPGSLRSRPSLLRVRCIAGFLLGSPLLPVRFGVGFGLSERLLSVRQITLSPFRLSLSRMLGLVALVSRPCESLGLLILVYGRMFLGCAKRRSVARTSIPVASLQSDETPRSHRAARGSYRRHRQRHPRRQSHEVDTVVRQCGRRQHLGAAACRMAAALAPGLTVLR
jgi:hypothetical protein